MDLNDVLMRANGIYKQLQQSSNLTVSTQRVVGLAHEVMSSKPNVIRTENFTEEDSSFEEVNIENQYENSIIQNYF